MLCCHYCDRHLGYLSVIMLHDNIDWVTIDHWSITLIAHVKYIGSCDYSVKE